MKRVLVVWWAGQAVGELTQDEGGELGFAYGPEWLADPNAPAISASLPKRLEPFPRRACRPFFGGLLPEDLQRKAAAQVLGISSVNDFAMLDRLGGDVAGALQFLHPGQQPPTSEGPWQPHPLEDGALLDLLKALPTRPLLAGEEGLRLSLAGAQSKVPVVLVQGRVALPCPGQPTTHILKPAIPRFEGSTENEAFAMNLAADAGLDVAKAEPRQVLTQAGVAQTFLLVERYDRTGLDAPPVRRLHQEDFCQALGVPVERKYQSEGGPTLGDSFALLRRVSARPAADILKLLDAVVVNAVLGNADAHGKNFSILNGATGPRLAPLYDLLSTVVYPELTARFAMKIGRASRLEAMDAQGWSDFAQQAELSLPFVRRRVGALAARLAEVAPGTLTKLTRSGFEVPAFAPLVQLVQARSELCLATLTRK